jgi:hypothetical protein
LIVEVFRAKDAAMTTNKSIASRVVRRKHRTARNEQHSGGDRREVARYIADMTTQLASMASGAHLDLLAYFLNMAHAESLSLVREPPEFAES